MDSGIAGYGFHAARENAAKTANAEDASVWRWFCDLYEEGRVRWCRAAEGWLVSVDHRHLSTEANFYDAIRLARERSTAGKRHGRSELKN
jgi:hypothetical protein